LATGGSNHFLVTAALFIPRNTFTAVAHTACVSFSFLLLTVAPLTLICRDQNKPIENLPANTKIKSLVPKSYLSIFENIQKSCIWNVLF
jgi:hypothetical protein